MATFPASLPRPSGYKLKPQSAFIRTDMEKGPARQRKLTDSPPTLIPIRWNMTQAQFQVFENFYDTTLVGGNDWFTIDLYNGMGYTSYSARFSAVFEADYKGFDNWVITSELEVLARPVTG